MKLKFIEKRVKELLDDIDNVKLIENENSYMFYMENWFDMMSIYENMLDELNEHLYEKHYKIEMNEKYNSVLIIINI